MLLLEELRIQMWFGHDMIKHAICREEIMERVRKYVVLGKYSRKMYFTIYV